MAAHDDMPVQEYIVNFILSHAGLYGNVTWLGDNVFEAKVVTRYDDLSAEVMEDVGIDLYSHIKRLIPDAELIKVAIFAPELRMQFTIPQASLDGWVNTHLRIMADRANSRGGIPAPPVPPAPPALV